MRRKLVAQALKNGSAYHKKLFAIFLEAARSHLIASAKNVTFGLTNAEDILANQRRIISILRFVSFSIYFHLFIYNL